MSELTFSRYVLLLAVVVFFLIVVIPAACGQVETKDVRQYIDHDAQVVCYILENGNGISCLPLDEIRQVGE